MKGVKAVVLLSGGLDSSLAAKLVKDQGVELIGVKFTSPFCTCDRGGRCHAKEVASQLQIPFKVIPKGEDYLKIIRKPRFGYGSGMNPCIDCRIYMLRKAWEFAKEVGARFLVTGEVLNQRPMSQHLRALKIIEKEADLEGKILRPLSAQLLPPSEAEREGWVNREKLLAIKGRSRKIQLKLADKLGIQDFACPAGGCLLTDKEFSAKLRDLFAHKKKLAWRDIVLLKVGRHFRFKRSKIIVGRNERENNLLLVFKQKRDYMFKVPEWGSPITILQGEKSPKAIQLAARLTARYSDCKEEVVSVKYGLKSFFRTIQVNNLTNEELERIKKLYKI